MQAVKCPVCNGTGKVQDNLSLSTVDTLECHGCQGKGWVAVPGDKLGSYPSGYYMDKISCGVQGDGLTTHKPTQL